MVSSFSCQKAPSAKRCIKTRQTRARNSSATTPFRKHRAPKGGLRRRRGTRLGRRAAPVRKPRAQKGALRLPPVAGRGINPDPCQKAPSAKRCIKTLSGWGRGELVVVVRKHRTPKGALRPNEAGSGTEDRSRASESTERQKVH